MTDPAQIPNMDAKQIAELHVIERYLADQLTDEEAHAFEAYVEAHPEVTRDIENISRMKAGLASLRQRGELAPLLVAERPRKPLWFLLAAAAAAVLVAVLVVPRYLGGGSNLPVLAASAQQLLGENEKPLPISARLLVGRARGATPNTLAAPRNDQGVELRLDVHADEPSVRYFVEFFRVSGTSLDPVGSLADAPSQLDGTVSVFVRGSALVEGNYLVRASTAGTTEPVEFTLRVDSPPP